MTSKTDEPKPQPSAALFECQAPHYWSAAYRRRNKEENEAEEDPDKKTVKKRICVDRLEENPESDPEENRNFKPAENRQFHPGADSLATDQGEERVIFAV